jgi:hypothetical protein
MQTGVRQGCIIAPAMFNVFIDFLVKEASKDLPEGCGFEIIFNIDGQLKRLTSKQILRSHSKEIISYLMYADDMALLCSDPSLMEHMIQKLEQVTQAWSMCISIPKTKIMTLSRLASTQPMHNITIRGEVVEVVNEFVYLGSTLSSDGSLDKEVDHRISVAAKAFHSLLRCFRCRSITRSTKVAVYKACVLPCLLYGCETWNTLKVHVQRLHVFHMNSLRRICKLSRRRKVRNQDILDMCKIEDIQTLLQRSRLRWLGHVGRMDDSRLPKKLVFPVVSGFRSCGKPKKRWSYVVRDDLEQKGLVLHWYRTCSDRAAWQAMLFDGRMN